ncbi:MAG: cyclopropane-fatty-acyl-phospholipid synthase family protein [Planctomycetota bacterium]
MTLMDWGIEAVERGLTPDALTRLAIRRLCARRLNEFDSLPLNPPTTAKERFLDSLRSGPIALVPEKANEQHYELPPEFFELVLGRRRKYSCCFFETDRSTLDEAEESALSITCESAELVDGQKILELGCGWGSLTLWMAERYPKSRITAVSNSVPQRRFIETQAKSRGLLNVQVVTADMNEFVPPAVGYDRVVSVEMFEHMRNYQMLLARIADWLAPAGKLFVHIFCHREYCYPFETEGSGNWMGRYFFTGGMMPSANLLRSFDGHLVVQKQFSWNGRHYQRTAEAWLEKMDKHQAEVLSILANAYGKQEARRWLHRWRVFFLAVAELFGYDKGNEWFVSHYLLEHARRQ